MTFRSLAYRIVFVLFLCGILAPMAGAAGEDRYPYGGGRGDNYGGRRAVQTADDARQVLKEYFGRKNVRIGEVREKEIYFEADILDRKGEVADTVIVNKRTGRIRSIY